MNGARKTITVQLDGNKQYDAHFEEVVYPDRTYGQYDSGAIYWIEPIDKVIFVSQTGEVYEHGTDHVIGIAPEIQMDYETWADKMAELEKELDWYG